MRGLFQPLTLLLLALGCLAGWPSVAQHITLRLDTTATYYQNEHLYLNTPDVLLLENDLTGDRRMLVGAEYEKLHHRPAVRRRGIWGWLGRTSPVPDSVSKVQNTTHDLGAFPGPGVYQLRLTRPVGATATSQFFNFFAFSGWPSDSSSQSSWIRPRVVQGATQQELLHTCELLTYAMLHAKQDTLHKKWDKLIAEALQTQPLQGDFALVLAPDQPLALLVKQGKVTTAPGAALTSLLPSLLDQLADPAFSTQTDNAQKATPLLTPAQAKDCARIIQAVARASPTPPLTCYDAGFCSELLLRAGVNERAAIGSFRLLSPPRRFRQLVLVFRLRRS